MANVTFPPWPVESRCSNETPHVCYLNLTGEQSLSGNSTENGTNEAASETSWQLPLGACIFLITDTSLASSWIVMANLLVIISFLRDAKLRIIQNYYIVSLAMSDLMIGSIVLPLGLYSFLHNQGWPIRNAALCKFWMVIDYVNSLQSSLSVCLISYDRFKMILHPIEYRNEESPKRAMLRIACTWTFSILFYGPACIFYGDWQGYSILTPDECDAEFRLTAWLTTLQACVEFAGPFILIVYCNARLLVYLRRRRTKMLEMRKVMEVGHKAETSPSEQAQKTANAEKPPTETAKKKEDPGQSKNAAEIKEIKKEQRAARSLMFLVGSYFSLWFFYEIVGNFIAPICDCVPGVIYQASYWLQYHISAVNPMIYAVTIDGFRRHFLIFFSYLMPCCVRHPDKAPPVGKNRVMPTTVAAVAGSSASK